MAVLVFSMVAVGLTRLAPTGTTFSMVETLVGAARHHIEAHHRLATKRILLFLVVYPITALLLFIGVAAGGSLLQLNEKLIYNRVGVAGCSGFRFVVQDLQPCVGRAGPLEGQTTMCNFYRVMLRLVQNGGVLLPQCGSLRKFSLIVGFFRNIPSSDMVPISVQLLRSRTHTATSDAVVRISRRHV